MNFEKIVLILIGAGISIFSILVVYAIKSRSERLKRKIGDKDSEFHKFRIKPPTWRFQKFHPSRCPHKNGVFRKFRGQKNFVCADCISIVSLDEVSERDKFKVEKL